MEGKKWKIRHKDEGWTGICEITDEVQISWSSHRMGFKVLYEITQDSYTPDGKYVEDPTIESLEELEFMEQI